MKLTFPDLDSAITAAKDAGFSIGTPHRKLCHAVIHQSYPGEVTVVLQATCPKAPAAAICAAAVAASPKEVA